MNISSQARKSLGLGMLGVCAVLGYAFLKPGGDSATANGDRAVAPAVPAAAQAPARQGPDMFAIVAQSDNRYANLNPKDFAVREADYGGHPAYNKAQQYLVCADYVESGKNVAQDLAEHDAAGTQGELKFAAWYNALKAEQCKNVTKADLQTVAALMHTAAQAGDLSAQSYELGQETEALRRSAAARASEHPEQPQNLAQEGGALLARATALAGKGDKEAAVLAAKLTATDQFGQKDLTTSAAWALVGMQQKGQLFNATSRVFEDEPYSTLGAEQRQSAAFSAQSLYARCCASR